MKKIKVVPISLIMIVLLLVAGIALELRVELQLGQYIPNKLISL